MTYKTLEEFTDYVKIAYSGFIKITYNDPSSDYIKKIKESLLSKELDEGKKNELEEMLKKVSPENSFSMLLDTIKDKFLSKLSIFNNEIKNKFLIANINNNEINACILRGENSFYAILIYEGLFNYLGEATKFLAASNDPKRVTFCEGYDINELTSKDYRAMFDSMKSLYLEKRIQHSPNILLNSEGNMQRAFFLIFSELFVICHEIAHYLNGDLENENLLLGMLDSDLQVLEEGKNHDIEYKADNKAFELVCEIIEKTNIMPPQLILFSLLFTFDVLMLLNVSASNSHPSSYNRLLNIVNNFFDSKTSEMVAKSYLDPTIIDIETGYFQTVPTMMKTNT